MTLFCLVVLRSTEVQEAARVFHISVDDGAKLVCVKDTLVVMVKAVASMKSLTSDLIVGQAGYKANKIQHLLSFTTPSSKIKREMFAFGLSVTRKIPSF